MKEISTTYARIVMVLLAVNMAFTGYAVYRLSDLQQEQIDSATGAPSSDEENIVQSSPTSEDNSVVDTKSTATPETPNTVSIE